MKTHAISIGYKVAVSAKTTVRFVYINNRK